MRRKNVLIILILAFVLLWVYRDSKTVLSLFGLKSDYFVDPWYYPRGSDGHIVKHDGFVLAYNEEWEQPDWVAYLLTKKNIEKGRVGHRRQFREDPKVETTSAYFDDYDGSGFYPAQLAPPEDFVWDAYLANMTYLMSNTSPQMAKFNRGIWLELEKQIRKWVEEENVLYVVCGPITNKRPKFYIGWNNRIAVPEYFYKVLLSMNDGKFKGIGFVLPNTESNRPLMEYAMSIDEVETATGLDFYPDLMSNHIEKDVEADSDVSLWKFSKQLYNDRIKYGNKE